MAIDTGAHRVAAFSPKGSSLYLARPQGRIAYDVTGERPLVICLPSMGDLRSVYTFLTPALIGQGYRVATMDMRGHGDSGATFETYDDVAAGSDLIALARHLGGPAVLIGNSRGGGLGGSRGARPRCRPGTHRPLRPHRARRLGRQARLSARAAAALGPGGVGAYYASQYRGRRPADLAEHQARIRESLRRSGHWLAFAATTHTSHRPVEERLGETRAATLVVMGERDRDFRDPAAEAGWIAERLGGAVVMVLGAGHYPQAGEPEGVSAAIAESLAVIYPRKQGEESTMHEHFASADYRVKEGKEEQLVATFKEWFEWTRREYDAFGSAKLIRDANDARHFVSWSSWKDAASRDAWRASEGFTRRLESVRALCDEFRGANYSLAVAVAEQRAPSEKAA
jgi:pimeloyl-ACP methyl ester carboxylesterase/quinol monooxygenase YgiN